MYSFLTLVLTAGISLIVGLVGMAIISTVLNARIGRLKTLQGAAVPISSVLQRGERFEVIALVEGRYVRLVIIHPYHDTTPYLVFTSGVTGLDRVEVGHYEYHALGNESSVTRVNVARMGSFET